MAGFLNPIDLKEISSEAALAKIETEEALEERNKKIKRELYEAFLAQEVHPDVVNRVNKAVSAAAKLGHHQIEVMTFPCSYCNDRGRRINNRDADWPESLEGFAKRAYDFYEKELRQLGFKVSAEVVSFEGGVPGTITMYLKW